MCEAICKNKIKVTLYTNILVNELDIKKIYGIKKNFKLKNIYYSNIKKSLDIIVFSLHIFFKIIFQRNKIYYTRDPFILFILLILRKNIVLEIHNRIDNYSKFLDNIILKFQLLSHKKIKLIVFITNNLKSYYFDKYTKLGKNIVLPDCFSQTNNNFKIKKIKKVKSVGYFGSLKKGKGVEMIKKISLFFPNLYFNVFGGTSNEIKKVKKLLPNLKFHGNIDHSKVSKEMTKQDILLMPYSKKVFGDGNQDLSMWMSPLKLFEYISANKPIISSDLKVLREVVDEKNIFFAKPDSLSSWIKTIKYVESNLNLISNKILYNKIKFSEFHWENRAKKILYLLKNVWI